MNVSPQDGDPDYESNLVARAAAGEEEAWRELLTDYFGAANATAERMIPNMAETVLSNTAVRLLIRKIDTFDATKGCLRAWIRLLAEYEARTLLKQCKRERRAIRAYAARQARDAPPDPELPEVCGESLAERLSTVDLLARKYFKPGTAETCSLLARGYDSPREIRDLLSDPVPPNVVSARKNRIFRQLRRHPQLRRAFLDARKPR